MEKLRVANSGLMSTKLFVIIFAICIEHQESYFLGLYASKYFATKYKVSDTYSDWTSDLVPEFCLGNWWTMFGLNWSWLNLPHASDEAIPFGPDGSTAKYKVTLAGGLVYICWWDMIMFLLVAKKGGPDCTIWCTMLDKHWFCTIWVSVLCHDPFCGLWQMTWHFSWTERSLLHWSAMLDSGYVQAKYHPLWWNKKLQSQKVSLAAQVEFGRFRDSSARKAHVLPNWFWVFNPTLLSIVVPESSKYKKYAGGILLRCTKRTLHLQVWNKATWQERQWSANSVS